MPPTSDEPQRHATRLGFPGPWLETAIVPDSMTRVAVDRRMAADVPSGWGFRRPLPVRIVGALAADG